MMLYNNTDDDLKVIYEQLKDRYQLVLTNTAALDEGFTVNCPILIGKAHGQILELYLDCEMFVMDVMDAEQTKGTHWHPNDVEQAVEDITDFFENEPKYKLHRFPKR